MSNIKLWLSVKEFAPLYGKKPKTIYEQIRTGGFPFAYRRTRGDAGSILISARDFGLIEPGANPQSKAATTNAKQKVVAA